MGKKLEMKLIKATNLKSVNWVSKMAVYAVVYVSNPIKKEEKLRTAADVNGGRNPEWNCNFNADFEDFWVEQNKAEILIDLRTSGSLRKRKNIGAVKLSVKDLLAWFESPDGRHDCCKHGKNMVFHTFQVMKPSGNLEGELHLCYTFEDISYPCQGRSTVQGTPVFGQTSGNQGLYPQVDTSEIYVDTPFPSWYVPTSKPYPYP